MLVLDSTNVESIAQDNRIIIHRSTQINSEHVAIQERM